MEMRESPQDDPLGYVHNGRALQAHERGSTGMQAFLQLASIPLVTIDCSIVWFVDCPLSSAVTLVDNYRRETSARRLHEPIRLSA